MKTIETQGKVVSNINVQTHYTRRKSPNIPSTSVLDIDSFKGDLRLMDVSSSDYL